mmetsp:Transcript_71114/g.230913  ORF Transcript_71114/g.230913 Transcript_71114/m.230913 type:complete len:82 (+) Transcript_71114:79-324(+)
MSLEEQFTSMVEFVKTWEEGKKASPDVLAHSYALFKQATVGDAPAQAPEDESKKAKYEEKAMTEYISFIEASTKLYGRAGA